MFKVMGGRLLVLGVFLCSCFSVSASSLSDLEPGQEVPNFRLLDQHGVSWELHRQTQAEAVVLFVVGNGCPIVRQMLPVLAGLQEEYSKKVRFLCLNANPQDDAASIRKEAAEFSIPFPILKDSSQMVAKSLGIDRTGEVLLIETMTWDLLYRGAIDDRLDYGVALPEPRNTWLSDALSAYLRGEEIEVKEVPSKGCSISFETNVRDGMEEISYAKDVAPILQNHCVPCHSKGNIGPFAMDGYKKVRGWASMIREVILTGRMPPWDADPNHGAFANDRSLTGEELRTLVTWIDHGRPRGEGPDPLAEEPSPQPADWRLGQPDYLVAMPEPIHVPATGVIPYKYVEVQVPVERDVWLRAAVVKPGNRKVLHHCLVFLRYPESMKHLQPRHRGGVDGFFAGYVPGTEAAPFPEGTGKFLPAGSTMIFQLHYTVTGKPEEDRTEVGLYVREEPPERVLRTRAAVKRELDIPPGDPEVPARATFVFEEDSLLYEMSPHMHYRGKWFRYTAQYPDGRSEILLSVPRYDFNWQLSYRLQKPKWMPAGTKLVCEGAFDNSRHNPYNPDPTQRVHFGEQTFDEMFIGYLHYVEAESNPVKKRERSFYQPKEIQKLP